MVKNGEPMDCNKIRDFLCERGFDAELAQGLNFAYNHVNVDFGGSSPIYAQVWPKGAHTDVEMWDARNPDCYKEGKTFFYTVAQEGRDAMVDYLHEIETQAQGTGWEAL